MIKVPPPGSLIPGIDIINASLSERKKRARCSNCLNQKLLACGGCFIGKSCEYPILECKTEDNEIC